jgi:SAM-dependent methyltransferase
MARLTKTTTTQIAAEWDKIVLARHKQITRRQDISYWNVLVPTIVDLLRDCDRSKVIDLGCGSGVLTKKLARHCVELLAIDVSKGSIAIAQQFCKGVPNIDFEVLSIEKLAKRFRSPVFTTAVANMTMATCANFKTCLKAIRNVTVPGGSFVLTVPHPCFWPRYWNYEKESWFDYKKELAVKATFKISLDACGQSTTHFHRPFESYASAFASAGFAIERIVEPYPKQRITKLYPTSWQFPRFLGFRLRREI